MPEACAGSGAGQAEPRCVAGDRAQGSSRATRLDGSSWLIRIERVARTAVILPLHLGGEAQLAHHPLNRKGRRRKGLPRPRRRKRDAQEPHVRRHFWQPCVAAVEGGKERNLARAGNA